MPHVDIELEDNKQFISNIPRTYEPRMVKQRSESPCIDSENNGSCAIILFFHLHNFTVSKWPLSFYDKAVENA